MKNLSLLLFLFFLCFKVLAQCGGTVLTVNNPSFEGTPAPHVTPPGWDICMPGVTPDTQPGSWGQTLPPSNGGSYLGLVTAPSFGWIEGAGQTLSSAMIAGTNYNFSIDLAVPATADPATGIVLPPWCVELQLWGGMSGINSGCDMSELLWTSPSVTNTTWVTYNLSFTPTSNWNHILFLIHAIPPPCTDGQYLFVDNMTPIVPVADVAQFNATTVCAGTATQFTDQSTSLSGIITNWTWDFGDSSPADNSQSPSHLYGSPGTYNVTLTIISSIPCTTTVVQQITVNAIPVVTISANPQVVCAGLPTILTASGAASFVWSNGLGTSNQVTTSPTTTTNYTVTGTTSGCSSTATITVGAGTVIANGVLLNDVECFNGSDGSAGVNITSGTAPFSYSWSPLGGSGSTASNLQAGTYIVSVTDSMGCQDTAQIIINQPTQLISDITDSTFILCYGASTGNASVTASGGTQPYSYLWQPLGGTSNTTTGIPAGTYQVTVTDDHSCTSTAQVTILQQPVMVININPVDESCPGSCNGSATATTSGGSQPFTYQWSTVPAQSNPNISGLCNGNYTVSVTDDNSCVMTESTVIGTSSSVFADFSAIPPSGVVPLNVQFFYNGSGASTYMWDFGDGTVGSGMNPSHIYNTAGMYTVILAVNSGPPDFCTDTFRIIIDAIQPSLLIVPNVFTPNNDNINDLFKPESIAIETMEVVIYNRWGKVVYEWNDPTGSWNGMHKNGAECSTGTYYYLLNAKGFDGIEYQLHGTVTLIK